MISQVSFIWFFITQSDDWTENNGGNYGKQFYSIAWKYSIETLAEETLLKYRPSAAEENGDNMAYEYNFVLYTALQ
jgi:hypothetical protein